MYHFQRCELQLFPYHILLYSLSLGPVPPWKDWGRASVEGICTHYAGVFCKEYLLHLSFICINLGYQLMGFIFLTQCISITAIGSTLKMTPVSF